MMALFLTMILNIVEMTLGYLIPLSFLLKGALSSDKEGMKRWLTHFLFLFVLKNTLFCVMHSIDMGVYGAILRVMIVSLLFAMGRTQLDKIVFNQIKRLDDCLIQENLDILRVQVKRGLVMFNLY